MPSDRLRQYIVANKLEKEAKKGMADNRAFVERLLKKAKGLGVFVRGVTYSERENVKFDDNELFAWVKKQCMIPDLDENGELQYEQDGEVVAWLDEDKWDSLTKIVIDEEKLEAAVDEGIIDLSNLPETCYTRSVSKVVTVDHKKVSGGASQEAGN